MSKFIVFTALAHASALISGVAFNEVEGGRATDPLDAATAAKFKGIPGYEIRDADAGEPPIRETAAVRKARLAEEARAAAEEQARAAAAAEEQRQADEAAAEAAAAAAEEAQRVADAAAAADAPAAEAAAEQ